MTSARCVRLAIVAAIAFFMSAFSQARADVLVHIDKSDQRMEVSVDGVPRYN